jgi:hypothetical protein
MTFSICDPEPALVSLMSGAFQLLKRPYVVRFLVRTALAQYSFFNFADDNTIARSAQKPRSLRSR